MQRHFSRDVAWNMASLAISGVAGIGINIAIMHWRGAEALGVFNQVFAFYIMASQLAVGGLQYATLKYCAQLQDDKAACAAVCSAALLLVAGIAGMMGVLLYLPRHALANLLDSPQIALGLAFVAPGLIVLSLNKVLSMTLNGMHHMRAFAVFGALRYLIALGILMVIIQKGLAAPYLVLSLTFSEAVLLVLQAVYINWALFPLRPLPTAAVRVWFGRHLSFGGKGFLSGVMLELNTRVDVLMLGYFLSDGAVGIYSFAAILAEGIAQLPFVVRRNVDPLLGRHFAANNREQITLLAKKVRKYLYPAMIGIGLIAVAVYPYAFTRLAGEGQMAVSWQVFAILTCGVVLGAGFRPFQGMLLMAGRPGLHTTFIGTLVLCNILLNALLIPPMGLVGAAVATATVMGIEIVLIRQFARKVCGVTL